MISVAIFQFNPMVVILNVFHHCMLWLNPFKLYCECFVVCCLTFMANELTKWHWCSGSTHTLTESAFEQYFCKDMYCIDAGMVRYTVFRSEQADSEIPPFQLHNPICQCLCSHLKIWSKVNLINKLHWRREQPASQSSSSFRFSHSSSVLTSEDMLHINVCVVLIFVVPHGSCAAFVLAF